jgi:type IV secretory pathway VirD2 relaxase
MAKNTAKGRMWSPGSLRDSPALTLTESPGFRVRLGIVKNSGTPKSRAFLGRMKALVRQHGANASGTYRRAQGGVGGSAAARLKVRTNPQRVIIKARVVRHAKFAAAKGGVAGALSKHIDYLGRASASQDKSKGLLFNSEEDLSRQATVSFRDELRDDRHHFRFIVSPEKGSALELKSFARELVHEMQIDLGTRLSWLGVAHYDTDDPHVHLLVRGKDEKGADLVINRHYLSHGMRLQAGEIATRRLGPRLREDIERSIERDLKADRLTPVDVKLAQAAAGHPEGFVSALRRADGSLAYETERLRTLSRLQYLESLGLAREVAPGIWKPPIDLVPRLKSLGTRGDIIKSMHARLAGVPAGSPSVLLSQGIVLAAPVLGRVLARAHADEMAEFETLVLDAQDGRIYYIPLSEYREAADARASVGSVVRVSAAHSQRGRAGSVKTLSVRDLASEIRVLGVTWLDREIAQGAPLNARPRIGGSAFEVEFSRALRARAAHLQELGIAEEIEGQIKPQVRFLEQLYSQELEEAARRLALQYGEWVRLEPGQKVQGKVASIEALPSGPHAVIASVEHRFSLVPTNTALTAQLGRTIALSMGRARGLGEDLGPPKLSMRFHVLELKRSRTLGGFQ